MPGKEGKIRAIACEGGGIRGLISATILAFVEEYTGRPIHKLVDLCAGTSTGGLMALALTMGPQPLTARECVDLYLRHGVDIFSRSSARALWTANGTFGPRYDGTGLKRTLQSTYGAQCLENALCPTMVTSYCLDTRLPVLHRSWCPDTHPRPLVDLGLATSAAPTYFPPAKLLGQSHIDGGVVANSPALSAVIEACKLFDVHTRDVVILSVGTGLCKAPVAATKAATWGKLGWVAPLIDIMLDGVPDLTDAQLSDLMPDGQYLHLEPSISADAASLDDTSTGNMQRLQAIALSVLDTQKSALVALLDRL